MVDISRLEEKYKILLFEPACGAASPHEYEFNTFDQIIGHNELLNEAKAKAKIVARTLVPVLIIGESGAGKEMFAQAIHQESCRRDRPFIAINCGAIPAEIIESELFGYEEGAFTGALKGGKVGIIEAASSGTLFLDEIESMPIYAQIKLLRALSTGRILKVGGARETSVDVRIIAATKKNLLREASDGLFREDLYYRISTAVVKIPALRERRDDIPILAEYFVAKFCDQYDKTGIVMDESFINALLCYDWRGNVRELEHAVEIAIIMLDIGQTLSQRHLPENIQECYLYSSTKALVQQALATDRRDQDPFALAEEMVLEHYLKNLNGNISAIAKQLKLNRKTIYNKINKHVRLRSFIS
jgi:transcriptional regulator with PAS, ATPase and Fis domain